MARIFLISVWSLTVSAHVLAEPCSPTWQENRDAHAPTDLTQDLPSLIHLVEVLQDEEDFENHLDRILIPRPVGSQNHAAIEAYISQTLTDLGWFVEYDSFQQDTPVGTHTFTNIMGHINPDSPRRMVLACHYETLYKLEGFLGAIDSAVPCAMLLHLASAMTDIFRAQNVVNSELSVTLLFFDGEEAFESWTYNDKLYGSTHLANEWNITNFMADSGLGFCQTEPANYLDRMNVLFLLDLVGAAEPTFNKVLFGEPPINPYYDMMTEIEDNIAKHFPIVTQPLFHGYNITYSPEDDHTPFEKNGMWRIFYVIDRPFPSMWHTLEDDKEHLDFEYIRVINMLLRVWTAQYVQYPGLT